MGVKNYLLVVLICISSVTSNVEYLHVLVDHLYMYFGEMSIHVLCPIKIGFDFLLLSCESFLYIMEIKPLSIYDLKLFSTI